MLRRMIVLAGIGVAMLAGIRCNDDNNTITGPNPTLTATAGPGGSTPTPGGATPTPTQPPAANRIVSVGQNGGNTFADQQSGSSTTTIAVGTTVEWRWVSGTHSVTSGGCTFGCASDGLFDSGTGTGMTFTRTFNQAGTFPYFCVIHGAMMQGTVIVQ